MTGVVHDVTQRSPEWVTLRLGRLCASRAAEALATIKTGEAAARRNLRVQLVLERITGRSQERDYINQAMQDGIDREPEAAGLYEAISGRLLRTVGFVSHPTLMAGYSPDGVVGEFEGLVELKCPQPATHLDYLKTGIVPKDYLAQVTHGLWLTGARWCDWMSFHPDFPEPLQTKLVRVDRNEAAIRDYQEKALAFLAEVDQEVEVVRVLAGGALTEVV